MTAAGRFAAGALIGFVKTYRLVISPLLPPRCRHLPTCSEYCIEALEKHGPLRGGILAVKRVARCHPWGTSGLDPVPDQASLKLFD